MIVFGKVVTAAAGDISGRASLARAAEQSKTIKDGRHRAKMCLADQPPGPRKGRERRSGHHHHHRDDANLEAKTNMSRMVIITNFSLTSADLLGAQWSEEAKRRRNSLLVR